MKEIVSIYDPQFIAAYKKWLEDLRTLETDGVLPISNKILYEIKGKGSDYYKLIYSFNIHTPNKFRPRQLFTEYKELLRKRGDLPFEINDPMLVNQLNLEEKIFPILLTYWHLLVSDGGDVAQRGLQELEVFFYLIIEDTKIENVKKALDGFEIISAEEGIFNRLGARSDRIRNRAMEYDFIDFLDNLIKNIDVNSKQ